MLDRAYAGYRWRSLVGRGVIPAPSPAFWNKGSETSVEIPQFLQDYLKSTSGRELGLQNYFWGRVPNGNAAGGGDDGDGDKGDGKDGKKGASATAASYLSNPANLPTYGQLQAGSVSPFIPRKRLWPVDPNNPPPGDGGGDGGDGGDGDGSTMGDWESGKFDPTMILGYNPQEVPGLSNWQQQVSQNIPELAYDPNQETIAGQLALGGLGGESATAEDSPEIQALKNVFDTSTKEILKNEATMGGYNRGSAVPDVLAKNWQAQLAPALQAQMGRKQAARQFASGQQMQAAQNRMQRLMNTFGIAMQQGETERGVEKEKAAANEAERLRLQALAEQSLFGPMGILPSTLGSRTGKAK